MLFNDFSFAGDCKFIVINFCIAFLIFAGNFVFFNLQSFTKIGQFCKSGIKFLSKTFGNQMTKYEAKLVSDELIQVPRY